MLEEFEEKSKPSTNKKPINTHAALVRLYLNHLKLKKQKPSYEYLCQLQKSHIESIAHENINGMFNFHSSFDISHLLKKYILENRGGLCFELNFSLGWLLHQLGFEVEMILSNVIAFEIHKENNPFPTHPINIVHLNGQQFLTDAGWCDSYRNPIPLAAAEYKDDSGVYRVITKDDKNVMQKYLEVPENSGQFVWLDQFAFNKPKGASLGAYTYPKGFIPAHAFTHIGPGYLFTNSFKYTRLSQTGHKTLWDKKFFTREDKHHTAEDFKGNTRKTLASEFKVEPSIAKQCIKPKRRLSAVNFFKPTTEQALLQQIETKHRRRKSLP